MIDISNCSSNCCYNRAESNLTIVKPSENDTLSDYTVFSGIHIIFRDIHSNECVFPFVDKCGMLQIDHCKQGRFEHTIEGNYYYLSEGDLSISKTDKYDNLGYYPTSHYHGITVLIDPDIAPKCLSCLLEDVEVCPEHLIEKFCSDEPCYIVRNSPTIEHIFYELYTVQEDIKSGYLKIKVLELLLYLSGMDSTKSEAISHNCSGVQANLAKNVLTYICENIKKPITAQQLANTFNVAPSTLQRSFRNVYGESVYSMIRYQKMQAAAKLLKDTDESVLCIAGKVGYDNASKFARAFTQVMGVNPSSYRNSK